MVIPDELVQQFRIVALERLDRVEAAWASVLNSVDDGAAISIHREVHTLKGESRMLGFTDVNLVCHKLEDLLEVARTRGYAVDEDFDLAVNMALRFMAMLVRKKVGAQLGGIDLPGFIKQIEGILAETKPDSRPTRSTGPMAPLKASGGSTRMSVGLRARLAPIAVDAFIEYAAARGARRDRLRTSWHGLRDLIGLQRAVVGAGQLAKHKAGAAMLARDLGKQVELAFELGTAEVTTEMLAAIDMATLHLLRNAIDHGLESPVARAAAGKPEAGRLTVRCGMQDERFVLSVEDDGRGVPLELVRARAIELGMIPPETTDIADRWVELVCAPAFSTRREATEISGRGVGLDAVRAGVMDVGGTLTATTREGHGSTWVVTLPVPELTLHGHVLRVPRLAFPIVLDGWWQSTGHEPGAPVFDVASRLGIADGDGAPRYFTRAGQTIGICADRDPQPTQARRLIALAPPAFAEVVTLDSVEGLLIHPERWLVAPTRPPTADTTTKSMF